MKATEATRSLPRRLGVGTATSVVVANMIGTGIFTLTGFMLGHVESGGLVLLAWVAGGLIALAGALSYAELATMMPHAGGEYVYLREVYGPLPAFLTGWTSFFVGFAAPIAATGMAFAAYLGKAGVVPNSRLGDKGIAVALVVLFTALHYTGLRWGARVQNLLTALKLVLLGGLIAAGFFAGSGSWAFLNHGSFWNAGRPGQLGVTLLLAMFAYSGWNAAAYIAEEVRDPARTLPRSLALGTVVVMALYLLFNLLLFYAVPAEGLRGVVTVGESAVKRLFSERAAAGFSLLVSLALLSSLSAYVLIGPRVYYAMARDGLFFRAAAHVHDRFQTPGYSIVAQGICAVALVLSGTFEDLVKYIGFALGVFPWMTIAGLFVLRRRAPNCARPYRVWGYPLVPLFYLGASAWILVVAFYNSPHTSLAAVVTVLAGIPVYWLTVGRKEQRS